jgi:predicted dinucleotide-binding enzyme
MGLVHGKGAKEKTMRIGVIGAGWLGGTVGRAWIVAGHEVMFSSRRPEKFAEMVRSLGVKASAGSFAEAARFGEVALLAVRFPAMPAVALDTAASLAGKVLLDATNPFPPDPDELIQAVEADGVALTTQRYFPAARLVRAFSSVDATQIEASAKCREEAKRLAVPLAGDDEEAVQIAGALVRDAGCASVVAGGLDQAFTFENGHDAFRLHVGAAEMARRLRG